MPIKSLLTAKPRKKATTFLPPGALKPPTSNGFDPLEKQQKALLNLTGTSSGPAGSPPKGPGSVSGGTRSTGSGDTGGGREASSSPASPKTETQWEVGYSLEGAPAWWQGFVSDSQNPQDRYLALLNSLIPYMSPEDQRRMATSLARNNEAFSGYTAEAIGTDFPTEISGDLISKFTAADRGTQILSTLETFADAAGLGDKDRGEGFGFLQDFGKLLRDFGGTGGDRASRTQMAQLRGQLDPLLSSANTDKLSPFGEIARTLAFPFFSAGELTPVTRTEDGSFIFGRPNPRFFT